MIQGIVKRISQRERNFGILIGETWYSGYGKCPYKEGESVSFNAEKRGNYWNIVSEKKDVKTSLKSNSFPSSIKIETADKIKLIDTIIDNEIMLLEKIYDKLQQTKLLQDLIENKDTERTWKLIETVYRCAKHEDRDY